MKQQTLLPNSKRRLEHGGTWSVGKRRGRRPLRLKQPLHFTLRSDMAKGKRSLLNNRHIVTHVIRKFSKRFRIKVYEKAICGNHLHCLVKGETREDLQNFFRVVAGHIAQEILRKYPLQAHEIKKPGGAPNSGRSHPKNVRKFWNLLLWSRVVSWGREYRTVINYILQNTKEALGLIAYKPRSRQCAENSA